MQGKKEEGWKIRTLERRMLTMLAIVAVLFPVLVGAVYSQSTQGVPSAKCAAGSSTVDFGPGTWTEDEDLTTIIKTSEPADLIISVTAEVALATNVTIKGTGSVEKSESYAGVKCRVKVLTDNGWQFAIPGEVVFGDRLMILKGLLWSPSQVDPNDLLKLPVQFIEIYEKTKSANGFNFVIKNVGSGVHTIKVEWVAETRVNPDPEGNENLLAVVGARTIVVEAVRMVND